MTTDFELLCDFLERTGDEVAGRSGEPPSEDFLEKMKRIAAGATTAAERSELCEVLRTKPHLVRVLADLIKDALQSPAARPRGSG